MTPLHTKISVWLIAIGFVMTFIAAASLFAYTFGSCIEPYFAGYVIQIPKPDQIYRGYIVKRETKREVEVVSFRLHNLRKLAPAIPIKYAYQVEAKLSDKINVSSDLCDPVTHQFEGGDLPTHPVGAVWDRTYCFEMPGTVADSQAVRVTGHAEHTRLVFGKPFPFWRSITPVPEFVVPALSN